MTNPRHVVVIGAGIVGVCCAHFALRQGLRVTLIDSATPGHQGASSFGNAGSIAWSNCLPTAMPGLLRQVPGWLLRDDGPLTIRWRHLPTLAPWLIRFVRSGNVAAATRAADALSMLHTPALELHRQLAAEAGVAGLVRETGYLHVYRDVNPTRLESLDWRLRAERGAALEVLDGAALHEREPALDRRYVQAVCIARQGYLADPGRLVEAYAQSFVAAGGRLVRSEVRDFERVDGRVRAVTLTTGPLAADAFVVAAGAWSGRLVRRLGLKLPLEAERGYHVSLPSSGVDLQHTVMDSVGKFVATPMDCGLRVAGTVELASVDAPPDYRRADQLLRAARDLLPGLRDSGMERWMGCRPSLPDGLPAVGPLPGHANVLAAFGHAHTGMVGAPNTGRIIASLLAGQAVNADLSPFSPGRFGASDR